MQISEAKTVGRVLREPYLVLDVGECKDWTDRALRWEMEAALDRAPPAGSCRSQGSTDRKQKKL